MSSLLSRLGERLALLLWRDRNGYDPATGTVGELHNVSLLTKWRRLWRGLRGSFRRDWQWYVTSLVAIAALVVSVVGYLHPIEASKEMNPAKGELTLHCVEQGQGVYRCRIPYGKDEVITRTDSDRRNSDRSPR